MSISKIKRGRLANYISTPIFDRIHCSVGVAL